MARYFCGGFCFLAVLLTTACHKTTPEQAPPANPQTNPNLPQAPAIAPRAMGPSAPMQAQNGPTPDQLACVDAYKLEKAGEHDKALASLDAVIKENPKNITAYMVKGQIYSKLKRWPEAQSIFETVVSLDDKNVAAKFDLSELKFLQKQFDLARPGFAALTNDPNLGDFVSYKVFLCDLFAGKEDVARSELDAFQAGGNASYYFGNAAWCLYHHQTEEARDWLTSAVRIYAPAKVDRYAFTLKEFGYLPLPDKPSN